MAWIKKVALIALSTLLASVSSSDKANSNAGELGMQIAAEGRSFRLVIRKRERHLLLYRRINGREELDRTLRIALGSQPTGTKTRQGDGATPEGEYYITHRNHASRYHLSLGLSYPNQSDAARGLDRKLITRQEYESISRAIDILEKPPQDTALGGDIFIHGGGTLSDWTAGCIALENQDIEHLFKRLPLETQVTILP